MTHFEPNEGVPVRPGTTSGGGPTLAEIAAFVDEVRPLMRLRDWSIRVSAGAPGDTAYTMRVQTTPAYREAYIEVAYFVLNGDSNRDWHQSVLHELAHLYACRHRDEFRRVLVSVEETHRALLEYLSVEAEEAVVQETAETIWQLYGASRTGA